MDELDFKTIGLKIRERRKSQGLTQEQVADILDVNASHISNIECGRSKPSLTTLLRISDALKCSIDYFLADEYTYRSGLVVEAESLDKQIMDRIKFFDGDKKQKVLKMIDLL